ncbi:MAG: hypothetical protein P0111_10560 [Nitrospira sp.]|nr:hypothetical protein [Nitrospira sp.]
MRRKLNCLQLVLVGFSVGITTMTYGLAAWADGHPQGEVETRGLPSMVQKAQPNTARAMQEPTWPQKFDVRGPETDGFGFAVTQPGQIVVDVQAQGPPITVTLRGPGLPPRTQTGAGRVQVTHQATPQDVSKGIFWGISIGLQQPGPNQAMGQVSVQHPPADPAKVQAAAVAQQQAAQQHAAQRQAELQQAGAQAAAQMEAAFQQRKTQFEQQRQQRHAALMAQAQPQIDRLRLKGPSQVRTRGGEGSDAESAAGITEEDHDIESRGLSKTRPTGPMVQAQPSEPTLNKMSEPQAQNTSPQLQGTSAALTYMPDPVILWLSPAKGQPGDPIMINGRDFGEAGGEVHFTIGPGKDLISSDVIWRNDQIYSTVPEATGVLGFTGSLYLIRRSDRKGSNLFPFKFEPGIELRSYQIPPGFVDKIERIDPFLRGVLEPSMEYIVWYTNINILWGFKDTNEYFLNTRLKNGWVLDDVFFVPTLCSGGCSYLIDKHVGSDKPYFAVRYWVNAGFTESDYAIHRITIRGPKDMPDGLVVP